MEKMMIRRLMVKKLIIIRQVVGGEEGEVKEKAKDFIQQTLTLILHFLGNLVDFFTKKLDELLPPETRDETLKHWLHIGLTIVLPILLILLFLYCCCCSCLHCCSLFFRASIKMTKACCRSCHRCCICCFRGSRKMMKAPGRHGTLMPRNSFEANTRGYFRDLRGKDSDFFF
ncbi:hypothetical protein IHE45_02G015000 [Dioscorea alata]|uniref:Uncharacterized protein n=1 Tax=Dioscorea alata TaxID=55571 RepID=A0ACB7WP92_DIOAL|nr:hypothetical protein IHE45_02G015000 [Dioscorea alata]